MFVAKTIDSTRKEKNPSNSNCRLKFVPSLMGSSTLLLIFAVGPSTKGFAESVSVRGQAHVVKLVVVL